MAASAAGAIGSCLPGATWSQAQTPADSDDDFFFIVGADPQLFWGPAELWAKAVEHINRLGPALAVICGDLINRNGDPAKIDLEADEKMARAYLETAEKVDRRIPLYNVAGNHDVCNRPTPQTLAWYEKRFGKPWYSFAHGRCLFIVLESDMLKHPEGVPEIAPQQISWLRRTLRDAAKEEYRHKVVFMHHPLCLRAVDEPDAYFNLPRPVRKQLLALLHNHGVTAVFSGHYHRNAYVKDGELELITTSSSGKPLGKDPVGLRIVKVRPERIEHAYYGYEELPAKVEL